MAEKVLESGGAPARPKRNQGLGRILVMVYAVFALSSFARSLYQLATGFSVAPLAYLLSAFAAAVYIVATLSLARSGRTAWYVSLVAVLVELVGVVDPRRINAMEVWRDAEALDGWRAVAHAPEMGDVDIDFGNMKRYDAEDGGPLF